MPLCAVVESTEKFLRNYVFLELNSMKGVETSTYKQINKNKNFYRNNDKILNGEVEKEAKMNSENIVKRHPVAISLSGGKCNARTTLISVLTSR